MMQKWMTKDMKDWKDKFLSFEGRMDQKTFLKRYLLLAIASHVLWLMMIFIEAGNVRFMAYLYPFLCLFYIPQASLVMRRANDIDLKRPIILAIIVLLFAPSVLFEFWTSAPRMLAILNQLMTFAILVGLYITKGVPYETLAGLPIKR